MLLEHGLDHPGRHGSSQLTLGHVLVGGMLPSGRRLLGRRSSACLPRSSLSAKFLQGGSQVSPTPVPGSQEALGEMFRSEPKWETHADRRVRLTATLPASQPRPRPSFACNAVFHPRGPHLYLLCSYPPGGGAVSCRKSNQSSNQCLSRTYCVPSTLPDSGYTAMHKTDTRIYILADKTAIKKSTLRSA